MDKWYVRFSSPEDDLTPQIKTLPGMKKSNSKNEQIVAALRDAESTTTAAAVCKHVGATYLSLA